MKMISVGEKFGRLTVVADTGLRNKDSARLLSCKCECGSVTVVRAAELIRGRSKSCGCLRTELKSARRLTHGDTKSTEYKSWIHAKCRCGNKNNPRFKDYGGRGIEVCKRWRESYEAFLSDMGRKPSPIHSIDRINNDGNYEPNNCRWATPKEQRQNQSRAA